MSKAEVHPELLPLLQDNDISVEIFRKKGRPPKGVREKRSAIVTALHKSGKSWAEMEEITGFSTGAIHRLTEAVGCQAMKQKQKQLGKAVGFSWKGKSRPNQLEKQWESGCFDHLKGRVRTPEERQKLREGWTEEARQRRSELSKELWDDPDMREQLLAFHRSPEERIRRSKAQARRMKENPSKYLRGKGCWVTPSKAKRDLFWIRSSYEKKAIEVLEADSNVMSYEYEKMITLPSGRWIFPDFLIQYVNKGLYLVEVKASWVLKRPEDSKERKRLQIAEEQVNQRGWGFSVWTEKELFDD